MKSVQMESTVVVGLAFATLVLLSATAFAQGTPDQRSACIGDAFRFCGADIPVVTKIEACLSQNRSSLSPACASEFQPAGRTALRPEHFRRD
jgi:hypothetical protein